jgi:hypothetical protein
MTFFLLKLTALALVVITSSVHALDELYVLPALRGFANVRILYQIILQQYRVTPLLMSNSHSFLQMNRIWGWSNSKIVVKMGRETDEARSRISGTMTAPMRGALKRAPIE